MDKLKTVQANSSLPLPQPTLSVAGFRCVFQQFPLFTIFEWIIMESENIEISKIRNMRSSMFFLTPLRNVLTNFRVQRSILAVGMPIQMKKPTSDPLTAEGLPSTWAVWFQCPGLQPLPNWCVAKGA